MSPASHAAILDRVGRDLVTLHGGPARVVIAGGGVAALEALMALRELAEHRVALELIAPGPRFVYKPLAVGEPFGLGRTRTYDLAKIAAEQGAVSRTGELLSVDCERRRVELSGGESVGYDALVVAIGARPTNPLPGSIVVQGPGYTSRFNTLLRELGRRKISRVVFAVPSPSAWSLPLYELALMTATRVAESRLRKVELTLVTPERSPLEIFGPDASAAVEALLTERGIELHAGSTPIAVEPGGLVVAEGDAEVVAAERVVGLPRLRGPRLEGLPIDAEGFIRGDEPGLVDGEVDVYAAGDVTAFPLKQGGLATQQADAAAESIAARAGAPVSPRPFKPVLRGVLLTGGVPRYLRSEPDASADRESEVAEYALWWPPAKIAGRYLSPYLGLRGEELEREAAGARGLPVEVELEQRAGPGIRRRAIIASTRSDERGIVIPLDPTGA